MATLTLICNCIDASEVLLENLSLAEAIMGSRNENFNYIGKMGVDLNIIRFEEKIVFTVTHESPYCVAVAIWLFEGCITQAINHLGEFKKNTSTDKYRVFKIMKLETLYQHEEIIRTAFGTGILC